MRFLIENMTCGGCARSVTRAIQSVDPTAGIQADPSSRRVTVQSEKPQASFLTVLEDAGYPAIPQ